MIKRHLVAISLVLVISTFGFDRAIAEELALVNRPINTSGLTGLLITTAPFTLPSGMLEIGAAVLSENSVRPEYRITEYPLTVTVGMRNNTEIAIRGSYFNIKEGPTGTVSTHHQTGDVELSYKWNFMPQAEDSVVPGVALLITGIAPTEKDPNMKASSISHWGMRIGLSAGTEFSWRDHVLGVYADAQLAGQDLTEKRLRDIYEIANAGLLFPISKYQNLQMFLEYSIVNGKDFIPLNGGDYSSFTYGLRLVSERFNLTIGTQFLHKKTENYDKSDRIDGLMSIKF